VVLSQADRTDAREAYPDLKQAFAERHGVELLLVSAAAHFQLDELLLTIARRLPPRTAVPSATATPAAPDPGQPPSGPETPEA
jgi:hypothetical protein